MDELDQLRDILDKTGDLIAATKRDQWSERVPSCPEFSVQDLLAHICGWERAFAAAANGERFEGDPAAYDVNDNAAEAFREQAARIVDGWRKHGTDRTVPMTMGDLPGSMVLNMTFMEYVTHGWDLAVATGQPVPFSDQEAHDTLQRAQATLQPQFRGTAIGAEVAVPEGAPALHRLVAFMGRQPVGS